MQRNQSNLPLSSDLRSS